MELLETMDTVARQEWLDPASDSVQRVVTSALHPPGRAGTWLDNLLNGTWLGHPLHPVLTDVPVGAWTVGLLLNGPATFPQPHYETRVRNGQIEVRAPRPAPERQPERQPA
jgi:shikimate kinase